MSAVPAVRGVLTIDLWPAVDDMMIMSGSEAARRIPVVPAGVEVELQIGPASAHDGTLGEVVAQLRSAGGITVTGTDPAGIAAVVGALRIAYRRAAA